MTKGLPGESGPDGASGPPESPPSNFRRNVFWNYFSGSVSLVSLIVFYPIGVRLSSPEHYGLWVLIFGGTQLLSAADFGLGDGVVRTLTQLLRSGSDRRSVREFVTIALGLFAAMAAIAGLTYAVVLPLYLRAVALQGIEPELVHFALAAGGVALMAAIGVRACNAILWSLDRQDIERKSTVVAVALRGVAYVGVWVSDAGFMGVVAADVIVALLPLIVCSSAVYRRFGRPVFSRLAYATHARPLLSLSLVLFAGSLASMLTLQLPLYIVGAQLGLTAATAFGALMRVYQSVRLVNSWMANPFIHGISTGVGPQLTRATVGAHLLTGAIGLGMAIALAGLGDALMVGWMGPTFAFAGTAMAAISLGALGDALSQPSRLVINLRGRPRWTALLNITTLTLVLIGSAAAATTGDILLVMLAVAGLPFLMTPAYLAVSRRVIGEPPLPVAQHPARSILVLAVTLALILTLRGADSLLSPWPAIAFGAVIVGAAVLLTMRRIWAAVRNDPATPPHTS